MAMRANNPHADAQQPGLRSFIIYDQLPTGCDAFEVKGHGSEPHLRDAEFAVIDPADTAPMMGELFAVRFDSGREAIVEVGLTDIVSIDGEHSTGWMIYWQKELVTACGSGTRTMRWSDGPYREHHLSDKLMGKVVGILEPDFRLALGGRP